MIRHEKEEYKQIIEPWLVERAREILKAQGRLFDFKVEDMDQDELREKVENAARSRRMREEGCSITHERIGQASGSGSRLIWDEVMK